MALLSPTTLVAALVLTALLPVACLLLWNRLGRWPVVRVLGRVALVGSCQLLAVASAGLALNASYDFYSSWGELLGRTDMPSASATAAVGTVDRTYARQLRAAFHGRHGLVVPWMIPGRASGVPASHALLYLPAAYGDPAAAAVRFPVVELLDGFPGRPESWTGSLELQRILDAEINARRSVPFIAVMPTQNLLFPRDTQCVDVASGPRVDTYLSHDVHRAVLGAVRAATDRSGWALMGYSTGGYCTLNLALRHPDLFAAAASLSGYGYPAHDSSTGNLFGGSVALQNANTPVWTAAHWRATSELSLLVMTSTKDRATYRDAVRLAAVVRAPLRLTTVVLPVGGHNFSVWRAMEPVAFDWLSARLVPPLAPAAPIGQPLPPTSPAPRAAPGGRVTGRRSRCPVTPSAPSGWRHAAWRSAGATRAGAGAAWAGVAVDR